VSITRAVACVTLISVAPAAAFAEERQATLGRFDMFSREAPRPPRPVPGGTTGSIPKYPPLPRARPADASSSSQARIEAAPAPPSAAALPAGAVVTTATASSSARPLKLAPVTPLY
jgi:hypothetical protein